jgi:hypothetical protein
MLKTGYVILSPAMSCMGYKLGTPYNVMLSAAKDLYALRDRPSTALSMTLLHRFPLSKFIIAKFSLSKRI